MAILIHSYNCLVMLKRISIYHIDKEEGPGPPAWKQLPTWYQISEGDHAIPPTVEHMFAKQMNATTVSINASHASYVSHPNEIAQLILNATKGIK